MEKKWLCVFVILIVFLFSGCASLKCLDGSCERQIKELTVTSDDLKKEIARLDAENKEKDKAVAAKQDEITKLQSEKATLNVQVRDLQEEVQKVKKENRAEAVTSETIAEKQATPKAEGAAGAGEKEVAPSKAVKIKVLAGDGRLASARKTARTIEKSGLKVEIVDLAPRANFAADTIYYKPDAEKEAKEIAAGLGEKTLLKPMTWSSAFNIIVVTGKKK